jgi:hypothetical protein
MSTQRIERTSIWKNTLAPMVNDEFQKERETLRSSFGAFRENASFLVAQISRSVPGLTQHDITHLDALWETASLIAGPNFFLTPLEGFVLGSSFLLHDSALCFEAYENGQEGLRNSIQWKDAFEDVRTSSPKAEISELQSSADFIALRNLHANEAEKLLERSWRGVDSSESFYLLENQKLRTHLGKIIGQIAASHHWDIERVISTFNSQLNAPTGFPREWRIDPIKIACLLRCSDASHIDNERALDFLHVLLKRSGVSYNHWKAQNRLAKVDIDQSDLTKSTLLFTSTIDFKESDSEAWYVAYDAFCLVDKELRSSNSVLTKLGKPSFQVKQVKGIESPELMSQFVKSVGWEPRTAKVHVGNVESIIKNLGGEMLYGTGTDNLGIVLRELIQNARDSIKAREIQFSSYQGKILLKVQFKSDRIWISVEDNGIGMSERILTGPLLDFGTSFWSSSLVQREFPGLRSSAFKSVGRFGIGFYSVFMIAEQVFISSKNFHEGLSDVCQLKFPNGFTLRPILTKGAPADFQPNVSTKVMLKLNEDIIPNDFLMDIKVNQAGQKNFKVPLKDYLASICIGLDVAVHYTQQNENEIVIHEGVESPDFDKLSWLNAVSFSEYQPNSAEIKGYIKLHLNRLKPIIENGRVLGLAAINTRTKFHQQDFLGTHTVGGLASTVHYRGGGSFIGFIDHIPKSAKRDSGKFTASESIIGEWAKNQLGDLMTMNLTPVEKYTAASALCEFKTDPLNLAQLLVLREGIGIAFMSFYELAVVAKSLPIILLKSKLLGEHMEVHHSINFLPGFAHVKPLALGSFLSLKMKDGKPDQNFSILDCLYRTIKLKGLIPEIKTVEKIGINSFNEVVHGLVISAK